MERYNILKEAAKIASNRDRELSFFDKIRQNWAEEQQV